MLRKTFKTSLFASAILAGVVALAVPAFANPRVGGAPMFASKNIIQNAVKSKDSTTLVAAVKAAGLVGTLEGPGPFTVFAPTNAAFAKLPDGTVQTLLKPANKGKLAAILEYHVLPGKFTAARLQEAIRAGGGRASLKTVEGGSLTAVDRGGRIEIEGAKGSHGYVTIPNVIQSNGVIHVINGVLLPG